MSQAYASTAATNPLRRLGLRLRQDPDSRSTSIGLAAVVVFHLLLFLLAPIFLRIEHLPSAPRPPSTARDFNIELTPEMFAKPPLPNSSGVCTLKASMTSWDNSGTLNVTRQYLAVWPV